MKRIPNMKNLLSKEQNEKSQEAVKAGADTAPDKQVAADSKAKIRQSPSINLNNSSSPGILSPSIRGSSLPPPAKTNTSVNNGKPHESKRRIAEGLGDFQRYTDRKKQK